MSFNPVAHSIRMDVMPITVMFKRLSKDAIIPTKAHPEDAAFDIFSTIDADIEPGGTVKVPLGFATEIEIGYWAAIFARSGIATKRGLRPANGVGVIDCNYRGEWVAVLYNDSNETQHIDKGERIAQFMLLPTYETKIVEVEELSDTERGDGGLGSSGRK